MGEEKLLLNEFEAAEMRSQSVKTLRNERFWGQGCPYIKLGRSVQYMVKDVREFIEFKKQELQVFLQASYILTGSSEGFNFQT